METVHVYTASWLYNPGFAPEPGGGIAVQNCRIVAVGSGADLVSRYGPATADYPGAVLMPGFVNAHTHLELSHFPAWRCRDGLDYHPHRFVDWIVQMIKVRRGVSSEELLTSLKAGIAISVRSGTTAVGDIVTSPALLAAYTGSRLGGRLYLELIGQERESFQERLEQAVSATTTLPAYRGWGLSPHAPYTLHRSLLPLIASAAADSSLPLSLHLAESREESDFLMTGGGAFAEELYPLVGWQEFIPPPQQISAAGYFDAGGVLGLTTLAVHCVQVSEADVELLARRRSTVCLCPRSNERLSVGTAPVSLFKKWGVPLCLGTDSLASNDSLSLWDECRFAVDQYGGWVTPEELLVMATRGGACGLGIAHDTGSLEVGRRADLQVVDLQGGICTPEQLMDRGRVIDCLCGGERYSSE